MPIFGFFASFLAINAITSSFIIQTVFIFYKLFPFITAKTIITKIIIAKIMIAKIIIAKIIIVKIIIAKISKRNTGLFPRSFLLK